MGWDIFISHASEDKAAVALPLKQALEQIGISVWIDIDQIKLGDSFRSKIDLGLQRCRFGVVVLSPNFFRKPWANAELDAFLNMEMSTSGQKDRISGLAQRQRRSWHVETGMASELLSPFATTHPPPPARHPAEESVWVAAHEDGLALRRELHRERCRHVAKVVGNLDALTACGLEEARSGVRQLAVVHSCVHHLATLGEFHDRSLTSPLDSFPSAGDLLLEGLTSMEH